MTTQYNITTYGTLTNTNGVLRNFSASNYATLPISNNLANDNFEVVIKFNTSLNSNDSQILWCVFDSSTLYPLYSMGIDAHKLYFETTTGMTQILEIVGSSTISLNTDYYVRLVRNNNTYTLSLSTDGSVWTTEGSSTNSNYPTYTDAVYYLGVYTYNDGGTQYFEQILDGEIDLNGSYITLDNTPIWKGVTNITRIQLRHDTAANWTSVNPILLEGEVGIETDTRKQKVGDGTTAWNSLAYSVNTINNEAFDGQWVSYSQTLISSATSLNGNTNLTYTVQVPDDGHIYEVLLRGEVETGSSSGNYCILSIQSNQLSSDWMFVCGNRTRTASSVGNQGSVIIPIKKANNNLTVRRNSGFQGNVTNLQMLAYRRVGTNS